MRNETKEAQDLRMADILEKTKMVEEQIARLGSPFN